MDKSQAEAFAREWIAAWNSHDLDRILDHYTEDFEMSSPVIRALMGEPAGKLCGKPAVREYWARALQRNQFLRFELIAAFAGVDSVVLHYRGHRGLSAEVFHFRSDGKIYAAFAHYADPPA